MGLDNNLLTALAWGLQGDTDFVRQYIEDHVKDLRRRRWTRMLAAIDGVTDATRFETCGCGVPPGEDCCANVESRGPDGRPVYRREDVIAAARRLAIGDILSAEDDAAFAGRVVERVADLRVQTPRNGEPWEILGRWAGPGLAAAAVGLVAGAVVWLSGVGVGNDTTVVGNIALGDPLQQVDAAEVPPVLLTTNQIPDVDAFLAFSLENQ